MSIVQSFNGLEDLNKDEEATKHFMQNLFMFTMYNPIALAIFTTFLEEKEITFSSDNLESTMAQFLTTDKFFRQIYMLYVEQCQNFAKSTMPETYNEKMNYMF